MEWSFVFFLNSIALGFGLAMDAFSVSLANGLHEPEMPFRRVLLIAGTFAFFQFLMPMTGWLLVHTVVETFKNLQPLIPWIAMLLLGYIGIHMILESRHEEDKPEGERLSVKLLVVQGIATSIDALSVGFTIAEYDALMAFVSAVIIGIVTMIICTAGLFIGKKFGTKIAGRASLAGGVILILIGLEILITSLL